MISALILFFPRTLSLISGTLDLLLVLIILNLSLSLQAQRRFAGIDGLSGLAVSTLLHPRAQLVAKASARGFNPKRYSAKSSDM